MQAHRALVLCLCAQCSGCDAAKNYLDPHGPRYAAAYSQDASSPARLPELGVVTFNIKFGDEYELAGEELAGHDRLRLADILLLQEMDAPRTDAIAERLQMNYVYYPGSVHENGRDFGNAVLSRWHIASDKKLILPHRNPTDGRVRIAVQATVESPYGAISVYSVHTETPWLGPRARLEQAQAILNDARLEGTGIVGGDFNTSDPGSVDETVELFQNGGYSWASRGSGETAGSLTLDHVFVRALAPLGAGTVDTAASDHRPEWARVTFATTR